MTPNRSIRQTLDFHEFVHRDTIMKVTNKMQLYRLIYFSLSALRVSGEKKTPETCRADKEK